MTLKFFFLAIVLSYDQDITGLVPSITFLYNNNINNNINNNNSISSNNFAIASISKAIKICVKLILYCM